MGHNVANCWHKKEKHVDQVRNNAGTVSLSSSSSTLVATDADTKELGLIESMSENAEQSWLGMFVGFVAINQFSVDSDFRACVSEKFCHPRDFVSQSLGYPRCGVQRDGSARRSVHKKSDAVHHLVGNRRFPIDSRGWLPETWRSWSRDDSAKKWRLTSCE